MPPKIPIINLDEIGKKIGLKLYLQLEKHWVKQTQLSEKLWTSQGNLSHLLTGKKWTWNLDQYWKIAEAIPISRQEFDQIVESAKKEVLWISEQKIDTKTPDEQIKFALNSKNLTQDQINEVMNFIAFKENGN